MFEIRELSIERSEGPNAPRVRVLERVSLEVAPGSAAALVGESGAGKTLTALSVMRLLPPSMRVREGAVLVAGEDLLQLGEREMRARRGAQVAMVFQEAARALNPVMRVGEQVVEAVRAKGGGAREAKRRAWALFEELGFDDLERRFRAYPHELSGGQRQRVLIAMALVNEPAVVIADEPTTALDASVQARALEVLRGRTRDRGRALLLITHDLAVANELCDEVFVMYAGRIVERAPVRLLWSSPAHPFTLALLRALPERAERGARLRAVPPPIVSPASIEGRGCAFRTRCDRARQDCETVTPALEERGAGHWVACHHPVSPT